MKKKQKTKINFVSLSKLLKGRDFRKLSKEEQLKISRIILKQIFQGSLPKSKKKEK